MKLQDVRVGQVLRSDKFDIVVKVVRVDDNDAELPVAVDFVSGNRNVLVSDDSFNPFGWDFLQWLHARPKDDKCDYLTLEDLRPIILKPTTLKISDLKVGDILIHPESKILLGVTRVGNNLDYKPGVIISAELEVIEVPDNDKIYHAGDDHLPLCVGKFWFFDTKEDAKTCGYPVDNIITIEDLVFKSQYEIKEDATSKLPSAKDLREQLADNIRKEFTKKAQQAIENLESSFKMDSKKIAIILVELVALGYHVRNDTISWQ